MSAIFGLADAPVPAAARVVLDRKRPEPRSIPQSLKRHFTVLALDHALRDLLAAVPARLGNER